MVVVGRVLDDDEDVVVVGGDEHLVLPASSCSRMDRSSDVDRTADPNCCKAGSERSIWIGLKDQRCQATATSLLLILRYRSSLVGSRSRTIDLARFASDDIRTEY